MKSKHRKAARSKQEDAQPQQPLTVEDALPGFIVESGELLREMEATLLECLAGTATAEHINLIFRAAHTIKGSAGLFGLEAIVSFVHGVETVLDRVRQGKLGMGKPLIELLLSCKDHAEALVGAAAAADGLANAQLEAQTRELLGALGNATEGCAATDSRARAHAPTAADAPAAAGEHATVDAPAAAGEHAAHSSGAIDGWHLSLRFQPDVLAAGMDPLAFIQYLTTFGEITGLALIEDGLPPAAELDPQRCYLGFEIALRTAADRERIESAFEFVREDCTLRLVPPHSPIETCAAALTEAGMNDERIQAVLLQCHGKSWTRPEQLDPESAAAAAPSGATIGPEIEPRSEGPKHPGTHPNARGTGDMEQRTVRVDAGKLDFLITRIGELIVAAAASDLAARRCADPELQESISTVSALVEQVREGALQLRMVKIGGTFSRFRRIVHDVARETGKEIRLVSRGEDTEVDKTLVERITDPLTHLVRNAIDHGIESADLRRERGKPAVGTVTLNAYHDSGTVVIEVSDDGGGLKRETILAKAAERGLIEPGAVLSDSQVWDLIFHPGFSTAEQVTNLSGRGVGMDVVKRNIAALRGTVGIKTSERIGTTVTVRLPLTLAIINGFQIGVGASTFVLPLETVDECIEFSAVPGHDFADLRGQILPFIRLRDLLKVAGPAGRRESVVVIKHGSDRAGIVVDTLIGESQTVIKPLRSLFRQADFVSGSSILGNGEVALILDVPALVRRAVTQARPVGIPEPRAAVSCVQSAALGAR